MKKFAEALVIALLMFLVIYGIFVILTSNFQIEAMIVGAFIALLGWDLLRR